MSPEERKRYWRTNLKLMAVLLTIWALVGLVAGTLLVETLNEVSIGNVPFGFWMGQQGSIFSFVAIIGIYVWRMEKLDESFGIDEDRDLAESRARVGGAD